MVIKKATMMDFEEIHTIFEEVHDLHLQNTNKVFKNTDPLTKEEFKLALENENSFSPTIILSIIITHTFLLY